MIGRTAAASERVHDLADWRVKAVHREEPSDAEPPMPSAPAAPASIVVAPRSASSPSRITSFAIR